MGNKRKNKIIYSIWLTEKEELNISEKLKKKVIYSGDLQLLGLVLERIYKRGDFEKK